MFAIRSLATLAFWMAFSTSTVSSSFSVVVVASKHTCVTNGNYISFKTNSHKFPENHLIYVIWHSSFKASQCCELMRSSYLRGPVAELGQNFSPVIWDDAHGVFSQSQFLQTGKSADVFHFIQLRKTEERIISSKKLHFETVGANNKLPVLICSCLSPS